MDHHLIFSLHACSQSWLVFGMKCKSLCHRVIFRQFIQFFKSDKLRTFGKLKKKKKSKRRGNFNWRFMGSPKSNHKYLLTHTYNETYLQMTLIFKKMFN